MKFGFRSIIVAMVVLFALGPPPALAQGNVEGSVYTSPHYDYQVQWGSPWFFVEESSEEGADVLVLSDGESNVLFSFAFDPTIDAVQTIAAFKEYFTSEGVSNLQPLTDELGNPVAGGDAAHAWDGLTGTTTLDDGSQLEVAIYFDVRILPGGIVHMMMGTVPSYFYDADTLQGWQDLASTALVNPDLTPTPDPQLRPTSIPFETPIVPATETPESLPTDTPVPLPTETPEIQITETPVPEPPAATPGEGEPAPAVATGPWRIAVRAVDQGQSIDYLALAPVDGKQWIVVYADVSNWSASSAELDTTTMTLSTTSGPVAPDQGATQSTADQLGLEPSNGRTVTIPAGGSIRIGLVYSIPSTENELLLAMDRVELPLEDAVGRQLDVTDPSTVAKWPDLTEARLLSVELNGSSIQLRIGMSGGPRVITLAGVGIPTDAPCYDNSAGLLRRLDVEVGNLIRLESDPALGDPDAFYVWTGSGKMLNQTLAADGLVIENDMPESARFGAWIEHTDELAEADGVGLWSECVGQL